MPTGSITPLTRWQVLVGATPQAGALLYTYLSNSATPQAVYTTSALNVEHTNPVVADSAGVFPIIYLSAVAHRFTITTSAGATIMAAQDGVYDFAQVYLGASTGGSLVGYTHGGTGALTTTVQARLRHVIDSADYVLPDTGVDVTTGVQAAINAARAIAAGPAFGTHTRAGKIIWRTGVYIVSNLDCTRCIGLEMVGKASWGVGFYASEQVSTSKPVFDFTGSSGCFVRGITAFGMTTAGAEPSVKPTCGFLIAETTPTGDSTANTFDSGTATTGWFTAAGIYIYGGVDHVFRDCGFANSQTGKPAVVASSSNDESLTSSYQTIATGTRATGDLSFRDCEIHGQNDAGATGATISLKGVYAVRFSGGLCDSSGDEHVLLQGTNEGIEFNGVQFYTESGTPADNLFFSNNATSQITVVAPYFNNAISASAPVLGGTGSYAGSRLIGVPSAQLDNDGANLHYAAESPFNCSAVGVSWAAGSTNYFGVAGGSATEAIASFKVGRAGILAGMYVSSSVAPTAGDTYIYTVMKNGVAGALTCTINGDTAPPGDLKASDLTHMISVAADDLISVRVVTSGGATTLTGTSAALGFIPAG